jgi:hypothetical protein
LPRSFETNGFAQFNETLECNDIPKEPYVAKLDSKNLYNYANELFHKHGKSKTASLYFDSVVFIPYYYIDQTTLTANNPINNKTISFNTNSNRSYASQIRASLDKSKCLSKSILHTKIHSNQLSHIHGIRVPHLKNGKSIYNTDLCDGISQHNVLNLIDTKSVEVKVPVTVGYVSHLLANSSRYFTNQMISVNCLFIDFEYFMFIWKKFTTDLLSAHNMTIY